MKIEPDYYVRPTSLGGSGDLNTTAVDKYPIVKTFGLRRVSFTFYAPAATSRSHTFVFKMTDDPRALLDRERIIKAVADGVSYTPVAKWTTLQLPAGSVHAEDQTGFSIMLPDEDLALGAAEGQCTVNLEHPFAFTYVELLTGGTAPTDGNDDISIWTSGY